jgi:hypothetical protein
MSAGSPLIGDAVDILYIGLTLVFFALSWAFIVMCDRLMEDKV